jgi:hypothetical protein
MRGSGLLPDRAKRRRLSGAPTRKGRCRCKVARSHETAAPTPSDRCVSRTDWLWNFERLQ